MQVLTSRLGRLNGLIYNSKNNCGVNFDLGGDLNDIKEGFEKKGGRIRSEGSFQQFRNFVSNMCMIEITCKGRDWTWANNRDGEGYVEERFDRFFASPGWTHQYPHAVVQNIQKQVSDHCMLILEAKPLDQKSKRRFYFDKRFLELPEVEKVIEHAWNSPCVGSPMY